MGEGGKVKARVSCCHNGRHHVRERLLRCPLISRLTGIKILSSRDLDLGLTRTHPRLRAQTKRKTVKTFVLNRPVIEASYSTCIIMRTKSLAQSQ